MDTPDKPAYQNNKTKKKSSVAFVKEKELWAKVYNDLDEAIKVRHYSPKTFKAYAGWIKQFQQFIREKVPESLFMDDVKSLLTHQAVERKVASSTQNQAFNSLLFQCVGSHRERSWLLQQNMAVICITNPNLTSHRVI